jgi:hypothetical protein
VIFSLKSNLNLSKVHHVDYIHIREFGVLVRPSTPAEPLEYEQHCIPVVLHSVMLKVFRYSIEANFLNRDGDGHANLGYETTKLQVDRDRAS